MDKMKMETYNLTVRNVERIGELFPNCITETREGEGHCVKQLILIY